ncbi:uncharacterized protein LOC136089186 isoform X2 [Hydra vulgaris]|uniref:Uncharacterized protein LOC136089186 isoform X2 n=1 Tax=Hydra vulgaris TaxID=6087 RepID=A0ABM4D9E9_HYDVU
MSYRIVNQDQPNSKSNDCDNKTALLQDTTSLKVLCELGKTEEIRNTYTPRIVYYDLIKNDKIKELSSLNEANVLDKTSGPCIQQLDEVLKANKVERQTYHGKCFVTAIEKHEVTGKNPNVAFELFK